MDVNTFRNVVVVVFIFNRQWIGRMWTLCYGGSLRSEKGKRKAELQSQKQSRHRRFFVHASIPGSAEICSVFGMRL